MLTFEEFSKALKVVLPFVPASTIKGADQGILYNKDTNVLSALGFTSGVYYFLSEPLYETNVFLPTSFIFALDKLPSSSSWEGLVKGNGNNFVVKSGCLTFKFPETQKIFSPMREFVGDICSVSPELITSIDKISSAMCKDDRKVNLHGLYFGKGQIYACDNVRVVSLNAPVPTLLEGQFLPFSCIEGIKKKQDITSVQFHETAFVFSNDVSIFYFTKTAAKFPDVIAIFLQAQQEEAPELEIDNADPEFLTFCSLVNSAGNRTVLEVEVRDRRLLLSTVDYSDEVSLSYSLPIVNLSGEFSKFYIGATIFLESLQGFKKFRVGSRGAYFFSEDSQCVCLKKTMR